MKKAITFAVVAGLLGLIGCSTSTSGTCGQDSSVVCTGGAAGYSCDDGIDPESTDSSLECSDGVAASDGSVLFCCFTFVTTGTSCREDSSVTTGCDDTSFGFSCSGSDTPEDADSTLVCSDPTIVNGVSLYCCTN